MKRLALLMFVAASLFAASTPPPTVTHVADEKKTSVTLEPNKLLKIVLPVPDDGPNEWQVIGVDVKRLKLVEAPKPVANAKTPSWSVTFLAMRLGRTTVRLVWVPKAENKEEPATAMREILVAVE